MSTRSIATPAAWQAILDQLPHPHALQSWAWGAFKSRWGWSAHPLVLAEEEGHAAALILKRQLPFTPFSILYAPKGPLLDYQNPALRQRVLAQLEQLARQEKALLIKIDPAWGTSVSILEKALLIKIDPDVPQATGFEPAEIDPIGTTLVSELQARGWLFSQEQVQFRNTVLLDLTRSEEDLLAAMKQKTRYNIRLAAKKGIVIRPGTPDDFPLLVAMYRETAARDGFTIRPTGYYLDAWQTFYQAGLAQPLLAEYEGEPVAGVLLVRSGPTVLYMYGASTEKERPRMPNHLLQWEAIRWAKAQGCTTYDFWGAPDEFVETDRMWGVWRFKEGFNGQVIQTIGAWDYPARPRLFRLYTQTLPRYIALIRRLRNSS